MKMNGHEEIAAALRNNLSWNVYPDGDNLQVSYSWRGTEGVRHIAVYEAPPGQERRKVEALEQNGPGQAVPAQIIQPIQGGVGAMTMNLRRKLGRRFLIFAHLNDGNLLHLEWISEGGAGGVAELRWFCEDLPDGWKILSLWSRSRLNPDSVKLCFGKELPYPLPSTLEAETPKKFRLRAPNERLTLKIDYDGKMVKVRSGGELRPES
jgi:hypothetical protein